MYNFSRLCQLTPDSLLFYFLPATILVLAFHAPFFKQKISSNEHTFIVLLFIIIILIWAFFGLHYATNLRSQTETTAIDNLIGDSFGAFNALFSGLGFVGMIFAIILQIKELKETQNELRAQNKEFELQNATALHARFENTFFNLLEAQRVIASKIQYDRSSGIISFKLFLQKFTTQINKFEKLSPCKWEFTNHTVQSITQQINKDCATRVRDITKNFSTLASGGEFDSYFRLTYRILKFVDTSDFSMLAKTQIKARNNGAKPSDIEVENEIIQLKNQYIGLLRAQLSAYELVALFYNYIIVENVKAKNFVEKFCLFNSLRKNLLADTNDLLLYRGNAFYNTSKTQKDISIEEVVHFLLSIHRNWIHEMPEDFINHLHSIYWEWFYGKCSFTEYNISE